MFTNFIQLFVFSSLIIFTCSCTLKKQGTEQSSDMSQRVATANAEGFDGAAGDGFNGFINPKIGMLLVPVEFNIPAGNTVTLKGENFFEGIKVTISGVECNVTKLDTRIKELNTLSCVLTSMVEKITNVLAVNKSGATTNVLPPVLLDTDGDGIEDARDNCPLSWNEEQDDIDFDKIGDVCDDLIVIEDNDYDGILDSIDNCPSNFNPAQENSDGDSMGDICDPDQANDNDGDGIINMDDNCPNQENPSQDDADEDGTGDACE